MYKKNNNRQKEIKEEKAEKRERLFVSSSEFLF